MARIVVLGVDIPGHTAAVHLRRKLSRQEYGIVAISPCANWNWVSSNIWVGTGKMDRRKVMFPSAPICRCKGTISHQAAAKVIYSENRDNGAKPQVEIESTARGSQGRRVFAHYDYLINTTDPKLNFAATLELGPDAGDAYSVCTPNHVQRAGAASQELVAKLKAGGHKRTIIGTGNGPYTCQGTASEYCFSTKFDLHQVGVRGQVELVYLTNEEKLGNFGMHGMRLRENGYSTDSQLWIGSFFRERQAKATTGTGVREVRKNSLTWEDYDGNMHKLNSDFAMLLPLSTGVSLEVRRLDGVPIPGMFNAAGFMRVDGNCASRPCEGQSHKDWSSTYQPPSYRNISIIGITFAPPHGVSEPYQTPNGMDIPPAPPRTGMPSGSIDKEVAMSTVDLIKKGSSAPLHEVSAAVLGVVCMTFTSTGLKNRSTATMVMSPIVPNQEKYLDNTG